MKRERMTNPKCLGGDFPDTFNAKSADSTGLKMRRITRAASFDHLVGGHKQRAKSSAKTSGARLGKQNEDVE
jgi:hypothetical protein